jgi:hypothetical protein
VRDDQPPRAEKRCRPGDRWGVDSDGNVLIAPLFVSGIHERAVERGLRIRRDSETGLPIFVGLIATVGDVDPGLSDAGKAAWLELVRRVGRRRVLLRGTRVQADGTSGLRIKTWALLP